MSITLKISANKKYTITFDSIWMKCMHKTLVCLHFADKNKVLRFVRGRKKYYNNYAQCIYLVENKSIDKLTDERKSDLHSIAHIWNSNR